MLNATANLLTAPRLAEVTSPFTAPTPAADSAPAPSSDGVTLSGAMASAAADPAAEAESGSRGTKIAMAIAAGLAGFVAVGVVAPTVTSLVSPQQTSTSVQVLHDLPSVLQQSVPAQATEALPTDPAQPAQPQDPAQLIKMLAVLAESSAQQLPQATQAQGQWAADAGQMKNTVHDISRHVDALIRDPKVNATEHHKAIDEGLAKLTRQMAQFNERLSKEGPTVDKFLGQNRDNLNQVGVVSFNLHASVDKTAAQFGRFTPERRALGALSGNFYDASKDLAMATEKTTDTRAEQKVLQDNMKTIGQFMTKLQQANEKARTDPKAMDTVDQGVRVLDQAFGQTQKLVELQEKDTQEASRRAHVGAENLVQGLQRLEQLSGGSATEAPNP